MIEFNMVEFSMVEFDGVPTPAPDLYELEFSVPLSEPAAPLLQVCAVVPWQRWRAEGGALASRNRDRSLWRDRASIVSTLTTVSSATGPPIQRGWPSHTRAAKAPARR